MLPPWSIVSGQYCDHRINFPLSSAVCFFLSGSEQAEWDPGCCQGYRHKDGGRAGGLHGWDRHPGLMQPPSHCQTAGCLLLWRQTLGEDADRLQNVFLAQSLLIRGMKTWMQRMHRETQEHSHTIVMANNSVIILLPCVFFLSPQTRLKNSAF